MKYVALAAVAAACLATSAHATVTFVGYQTGLNPDETLITDFEGGPSLSSATFAQPGFTLTGTAQLFTGSAAGLSAAPAMSPSSHDTTQYLSVQGGQDATFSTPLLQEVSFYVGSLDTYNSFTFKLADGTTQTITGTTLGALTAADADGNQTAVNTNGRLTFTFGSAIQGVTLASGGNSLEVSNIGGVVDALVPEPTTWAMMIVGFGGIGALLRRRRTFALAA